MKNRFAACCGPFVVWSLAASLSAQSPSPISPGLPGDRPTQGDAAQAEPIVVSATRLPLAEDQSPAEVTVIPAEEMAERQTDRIADALRAVPGISVSQSGAPGQLTSVFTRGLESRHTQVLIDGVPINQGLAGQFNFADLTSDGLSRVEVQRGPQSVLYGPGALAGTIQLFTRRGDDGGTPRAFTFDAAEEGGSFGTFRERADVAGVLGTGPAAPAPAVASKDAKDGKGRISTDASTLASGLGVFDYSVAASRLDTDNDRPNNQYRNTAVISDLGFTPRLLKLDGGTAPRFGLLVTYSNSDTGDPNTIDNPSPFDNLVSERQLYAPNIDWQTTNWLHQHLVLDYDKERQVNAPNDPFGFGNTPTRGQINRYQVDYQADIAFTHWATLTTGAFYEQTFAYQRTFTPARAQTAYINDFQTNAAGFAQLSVAPVKNALLAIGGRYDSFNDAGDIWTYRVASSYYVEKTGTTLRSTVATGYAPPTAQDRIFGNNLNLSPEKSFGYDFGIEQSAFKDRLRVGVSYFYNDLSNVIGYTTDFFQLQNLGSARTQGIELFARWEPIHNLLLRGTYTYLDAKSTAGGDFGNNLAPGARLPRRPRNEAFLSVGYRLPGVLSGLSASVEAKIVNGREDLDFNTPTGAPRNFDLGGYTNVRLLASYAVNRHFEVYGRIENLTNTSYEEVAGYPTLHRGIFGGGAVHF